MRATRNISEGRLLVVLTLLFVLSIVVGGPYVSRVLEIQKPKQPADQASIEQALDASNLRYINSYLEQQLDSEQWESIKPRVEEIIQSGATLNEKLGRINELVPQLED